MFISCWLTCHLQLIVKVTCIFSQQINNYLYQNFFFSKNIVIPYFTKYICTILPFLLICSCCHHGSGQWLPKNNTPCLLERIRMDSNWLSEIHSNQCYQAYAFEEQPFIYSRLLKVDISLIINQQTCFFSIPNLI